MRAAPRAGAPPATASSAAGATEPVTLPRCDGLPAAIFCFDAGIWGYESWRPALRFGAAVLRRPVVVTSYNGFEAEDDADVIEDEFQIVLPPPPNAADGEEGDRAAAGAADPPAASAAAASSSAAAVALEVNGAGGEGSPSGGRVWYVWEAEPNPWRSLVEKEESLAVGDAVGGRRLADNAWWQCIAWEEGGGRMGQ